MTGRTERLSSLLVATALTVPALPVAAQGIELVAADPRAEALYVYGVPGLDLLARFDGIAIDTHAGAIALPTGEVLLVDGKGQALLVLDLSGEVPAIADRIAIPALEAEGFAWTAVDPTGRYHVTTSHSHDTNLEVVSIVDLETSAVTQLKVDKGEGEVGVVIGGEPAQLILHLADRAEVYPLATLLAADPDDLLDGVIRPVSTVPVGPGGHGNSFADQTGLWIGSTEQGLEIAALDGSLLAEPRVVSWDADGRTGGQNYRQRLTADGSTIFGPILAAPEPARWAEGQVDLHWATLADGTALRTPLATGIVSRGGISDGLAAYARIGADGDQLLLIDIDPASAGFRDTVAAIDLEPLTDGPVAGRDPAGTERRHAGISPDSQWAFVTHGGDGRISIIDTAEQRVVGTIETPTALQGGGYVLAVQPGSAFWETAGR